MSERQLGDVGTEMQWEDEHVMTWDLVLEPGQSSDWHQHSESVCVHRDPPRQAQG